MWGVLSVWSSAFGRTQGQSCLCVLELMVKNGKICSLAWVFCSFSLLLVNNNSQDDLAFLIAHPIHLGGGILPDQPLSCIPSPFFSGRAGKDVRCDRSQGKQKGPFSFVKGNAGYSQPGLFPYGEEHGRWAEEEFLENKPSAGWRWCQGSCSEEWNQF